MPISSAHPSILPSADGTVIGYQTLGSGEGLIVVGGATLTAQDYLPLARVLAAFYTVHVPDRRGRGASGPQGPGYSLETEREDLLALQHRTGATLVFGHSYGGLIALETARRSQVFRKITVYEPGVSIAGSMPLGWLPESRRLLAAGDSRGAFAAMVGQAGFAPRQLTAMPPWCLRAFLRLFMPARQWRETEPLLQPTLAENERIACLDEGTADRYAAITSPVLLLGGSKSPAFALAGIEALHRVIPDSAMEIINGLGHAAPARKTPQEVGQRILRFLQPAGEPGRLRR